MAAAGMGPSFDTLLSEVAGRRDLDTPLLLRVADSIAAMHAAEPAVPESPPIATSLPEQAAELARHSARLRYTSSLHRPVKMVLVPV